MNPNPKPAIFIRTYPKDFQWLGYALKSINKFVTGFSEIIVALPNPKPLKHLTAEKVVQVDDLPNGYIGQQLSKLEAWKHTDAEFITFWDSDVIAMEPFDLGELFLDGKPILYKEAYERLDVNARSWQETVRRALGYCDDYEYMRRLPLTYHRSTLVETGRAIEKQHSTSLMGYLAAAARFSEFNTLGTHLAACQMDGYVIVDVADAPPPLNKTHQHWSYGGVTPRLRSELDKLLA